jgi:chromosome segregation ATPase
VSERGDSLMEIFGATLGQVEHRLEQLTNPVFERGMVEVLMKGIKDLLVERASLAMELAEAHNEIDSQAEAIDGYEEELAEDAALIERSTAMIDRLTAENRNLHNQLTMARANLGNGGLKLVPQATAHLRPNSVEAVYRRLHQD